MGTPSSNPGLRTFPDPARYLSPTSLPVSSDLSYHNKGENANESILKKRRKKKKNSLQSPWGRNPQPTLNYNMILDSAYRVYSLTLTKHQTEETIAWYPLSKWFKSNHRVNMVLTSLVNRLKSSHWKDYHEKFQYNFFYFFYILVSIIKQNYENYYSQVRNRQFQTLVGKNALMSWTEVLKSESMFKQVFSLICSVCVGATELPARTD